MSKGKKGFGRRKRTTPIFNLLITGQQCSGKQTFLHTLFHTIRSARPNSTFSDNDSSQASQTQSDEATMKSDEFAMRKVCHGQFEVKFAGNESEPFLLNVVDIGGYDPCWSTDGELQRWLVSLQSELDKRSSQTLAEEIRLLRTPKKPDVLLHACLFFFSSQSLIQNGGLTAADATVLERLNSHIRLIPAVGKSDTLLVKEYTIVAKYLQSLNELGDNSLPLPVYNDAYSDGGFCDTLASGDSRKHPDSELTLNSEEDAPYRSQSAKPFFLFGASLRETDGAPDFEVDANGNIGRRFPFGFASCLNRAHSDLSALCDTLEQSAVALIEDAHTQYYEDWRTRKLTTLSHALGFEPSGEGSFKSPANGNSTLTRINAAKLLHEPSKNNSSKEVPTLHSKGPDTLSTLDPMSTNPNQYAAKLSDMKLCTASKTSSFYQSQRMTRFIQTFTS